VDHGKPPWNPGGINSDGNKEVHRSREVNAAVKPDNIRLLAGKERVEAGANSSDIGSHVDFVLEISRF